MNYALLAASIGVGIFVVIDSLRTALLRCCYEEPARRQCIQPRRLWGDDLLSLASNPKLLKSLATLEYARLLGTLTGIKLVGRGDILYSLGRFERLRLVSRLARRCGFGNAFRAYRLYREALTLAEGSEGRLLSLTVRICREMEVLRRACSER